MRTAVFKDPATYAGQGICPRCGSGWPICADRGPDGQRNWSHEETCAIYRWADYTCGRCSLDLALDNDHMRELGLNA